MRNSLIAKSLGGLIVMFGVLSMFTYIVRYPSIPLFVLSVLVGIFGVGVAIENWLSIKIAKVIIPFFAFVMVIGLVLPHPDSPWSSGGGGYRLVGYFALTLILVIYSCLLFVVFRERPRNG